MNKIVLTQEKETLLIPLFGKAREGGKKAPILIDQKASEIVSKIEYNFKSLKIPDKTNIIMCLRAKLMDDFIRDFLSKSPDCAALHLGCGLDSRYERIDNSDADWYDVDFKEVIDVRRNFYRESEKYHMIPSSVTDSNWLENIPQGKEQYIVIAEGLFMYLKEEGIRKLLFNLMDRIGSYTIIFDAFSANTAKRVRNHPSVKSTGATIHWGIDDARELMQWGTGINFVEEQFFTANKEIENLDTMTKIMYKMADRFPSARKAHRILIYTVNP